MLCFPQTKAIVVLLVVLLVALGGVAMVNAFAPCGMFLNNNDKHRTCSVVVSSVWSNQQLFATSPTRVYIPAAFHVSITDAPPPFDSPAAAGAVSSVTRPETDATDNHHPMWQQPPPHVDAHAQTTVLDPEQRIILRPDDMNTVHDPLWPRLATIDTKQPQTPFHANNNHNHMNTQRVSKPGRIVRPCDISTVKDPLWPQLRQL